MRAGNNKIEQLPQVRSIASVLILAIFSGVGAASADVLPASYSTNCGANTTSCGGAYNIDSNGAPHLYVSAKVDLGVESGNTPSVSADISSDVHAYIGQPYAASLTYYIGVYSGENLVTDGVPAYMTVTGAASRGSTGGTFDNGWADARVTAGGQIFTACVGRSSFSSGFRQSCEDAGNPAAFNSTFKTVIHSNDAIYMGVSVDGDNTDATSLKYSAYADPIIQIDPEFSALHPEYKLVLSNGLNAAPVPVPSSVWLLISGIGGLGVIGKKRKQV